MGIFATATPVSSILELKAQLYKSQEDDKLVRGELYNRHAHSRHPPWILFTTMFLRVVSVLNSITDLQLTYRSFLPSVRKRTVPSPLSSFPCRKISSRNLTTVSAVLETKDIAAAKLVETPVRIIALVCEGSISPLKSAPWEEVMLHTDEVSRCKLREEQGGDIYQTIPPTIISPLIYKTLLVFNG